MQSPGNSVIKNPPANAGDVSSIPGLVRSPGEGIGNPLQYYCLENPRDGGAWRATVHRVAKSRTRLSDFTFTFTFYCLRQGSKLKKISSFDPCIRKIPWRGKWQPTPVFLPGESHGQTSLVDFHGRLPKSRTWSTWRITHASA